MGFPELLLTLFWLLIHLWEHGFFAEDSPQISENTEEDSEKDDLQKTNDIANEESENNDNH